MRLAAPLLCLVATGCASFAQSGAPARGTVEGIVLSAPSCPVERAGSPCPPRPVPSATVTLLAGNDAQLEAKTNADGRFTLTAAPGTYQVTATTNLSKAHARVIVWPGATASVRLVVDSGIR